MTKLIFNSDDFLYEATAEANANKAQAIHDKWLQETGVRVWANRDVVKFGWPNDWRSPIWTDATHQAILVCQEEIEKEKCKHPRVISTAVDYEFQCIDCREYITPTGWKNAP